MQLQLITWLIPFAGLAAIAFALYLARDVLGRDTGTQAMVDVGDTIREGADAFVKRQYTTIGLLALAGAVIIGVVIALVESRDVADVPDLAGGPIGIMTGIAFLVGAACSMASGIIGMFVSVRSNVRTAAAARRSLVEAVQVAMRGGAVSGFLVVALSLLGVTSANSDRDSGGLAGALAGFVSSHWISLALAAIFAGVAAAHFRKAWTRRYQDHFEAGGDAMKFIDPISITGLTARGIIFIIIAILFVAMFGFGPFAV